MNKTCIYNVLRKISLFAVISIFSLSLFAQQSVTVTGKVTDAEGKPLPGTTVMLKGSTTGTVTDADGNYSITAPDGTSVLVFSFVGYSTMELTANEAKQGPVLMSDDASQIEEVVVVGYGTMEKRQLTSSIQSISAKELPQGVAGATIANAMRGKISNLQIAETASPNSDLTLQLRGMASINSGRGPLVVIDGMPGGDIRSVIKEDIESIDVLKDASAGAIYGTRATGGVILITTKKASQGKMRLSYTGEAIFNKNFGKPRVLTASEFRQYKPTANDYGASVDWWDEGMQDGTSNRHVLSLDGGSDAARVYASFMYEDNKGVVMNDNRKDMSGRINGQFKLVDGWLDVNTHLNYRQSKRNKATPDIGALVRNNPTHDPNDLSKWDPKTGGLAEVNVIEDAKLITNEGIDTWFRPDVELKLNILPIKGLSYHQTFGYEHRQWEAHQYQPSNSTLTEGNNPSGRGAAYLEFNKTDIFNADGYFTYVRNFGDKHSINAVAGYNYYEKNGEMFSIKNYGFAVDGIKMWDIGSGIGLNNPSESYKAAISSKKEITQRLMAYFARVNYSLLDKYIISGTIREEGSSKFATNKRWGTFWQLSGAWRISKENFMQGISWLNDLKIRAAYGITGNEDFSADYAATMYGSDSGWWWKTPDGTWARAYGVTENINPDLGWEEKHEWNVGVDFQLLNHRLTGKFDLFQRNTKGLLYKVNVPQPPYVQSQMYKNIGTLSSTGWEFEIGATVVENSDWRYFTKLNLAHTSTKVGTLTGDQTYYTAGYVGRAGDTHRLEKDVQVGSFWLYKHAGFDGDGRFQAYDKDGKVITPETDGKNMDDKYFIGNYYPSVQAGWYHELTWKNFSFSMQMISWLNFDIYNEMEHTLGTIQGVPASNSNILLDAYTKNAAIKGQTLESSYFLQDGSFLKIQNISLGYTFDTKKALKVMSSARLYLTINNVCTLTGYDGLNPEVNVLGWENGLEYATVYPQTRSFALGLQITF